MVGILVLHRTMDKTHDRIDLPVDTARQAIPVANNQVQCTSMQTVVVME